ncbi:unnamed protein product [Mesocestoides corti]|uniref:dolichol kinase n=1 Tax=Mesocestoides corti TaxID=53468 RepID=A0A0R3U1H7_MESCO|nr:unnamed protein product [Mesocestoides corti]
MSEKVSAQIPPEKSTTTLLAEPIIGWSLLAALILTGSSPSVWIFLLGTLLVELGVILKIDKLPGSRGEGPPTGAWLVALVPTILLPHDSNAALCLVGGSFTTFVLFLFMLEISVSTVAFAAIWFICAHLTNLTFSLYFFAICVFLFFLSAELLADFPGSLTLWEAILLTQICLVFHINTSLFIIPLLCFYAVERFKMVVSVETFGTLFAAFIWLLPLLADLADRAQYEGNGEYYPPVLQLNPSSLIRELVKPLNILLVTTLWAPLCILAVLVVACVREIGVEGSMFNLRKLFHFLAGIVYSTGLLVSPYLLSVASTFVLVSFCLIEWVRRKGPSPVSTILNDILQPFRDSRDSGELIFTPIALLLGLSLPIWNFCIPLPTQTDGELLLLRLSPRAWCGVVTIALGDSIAALVGRRWGKYWLRWPGTHRTLIGSLASFASQILLWSALSVLYDWPWTTGLLPLSIGVLAEAYTEQIDNLAIPLLVMCLTPA